MRTSLVATALALAALAGCKQPDPPPIVDEFRDDFERDVIGSNYRATADVYRLKDGQLNVSMAHNHPLWLRKKLPADAIVELDIMSRSPSGDMKIELFGDGESHARDRGAYTATGYVFIMGGWGNSRSIIARGDEHGKDVKARTEPKVEPGRWYHWKIVRKGNRIDWFVDDMSTPFLSFDDSHPFVGPGHEFLGFNNWESDIWFDNLVVRRLEPEAL
jgi:hypothetical protein